MKIRLKEKLQWIFIFLGQTGPATLVPPISISTDFSRGFTEFAVYGHYNLQSERSEVRNSWKEYLHELLNIAHLIITPL